MLHRQADQLAVAIWSPVSPQKHQHCARIEAFGEPPRLFGLVDEVEVGEHPVTITLPPRGHDRSSYQPVDTCDPRQ